MLNPNTLSLIRNQSVETKTQPDTTKPEKQLTVITQKLGQSTEIQIN